MREQQQPQQQFLDPKELRAKGLTVNAKSVTLQVDVILTDKATGKYAGEIPLNGVRIFEAEFFPGLEDWLKLQGLIEPKEEPAAVEG